MKGSALAVLACAALALATSAQNMIESPAASVAPAGEGRGLLDLEPLPAGQQQQALTSASGNLFTILNDEIDFEDLLINMVLQRTSQSNTLLQGQGAALPLIPLEGSQVTEPQQSQQPMAAEPMQPTPAAVPEIPVQDVSSNAVGVDLRAEPEVSAPVPKNVGLQQSEPLPLSSQPIDAGMAAPEITLLASQNSNPATGTTSLASSQPTPLSDLVEAVEDAIDTFGPSVLGALGINEAAAPASDATLPQDQQPVGKQTIDAGEPLPPVSNTIEPSVVVEDNVQGNQQVSSPAQAPAMLPETSNVGMMLMQLETTAQQPQEPAAQPETVNLDTLSRINIDSLELIDEPQMAPLAASPVQPQEDSEQLSSNADAKSIMVSESDSQVTPPMVSEIGYSFQTPVRNYYNALQNSVATYKPTQHQLSYQNNPVFKPINLLSIQRVRPSWKTELPPLRRSYKPTHTAKPSALTYASRPVHTTKPSPSTYGARTIHIAQPQRLYSAPEPVYSLQRQPLSYTRPVYTSYY